MGSFELLMGSCELLMGSCELLRGSCELLRGSCELLSSRTPINPVPDVGCSWKKRKEGEGCEVKVDYRRGSKVKGFSVIGLHGHRVGNREKLKPIHTEADPHARAPSQTISCTGEGAG